MNNTQSNTASQNTPLQPGFIRMVRLKTEGRLQAGDVVETARLGKCTVAYIQTADSICVKNGEGKYFNLSGFGFNARLAGATTS